MKKLISTALLMAAIASPVAAADLDEIICRKELRVAVEPLSPFVILGEDGALTCYEIDAMAALGEKLGVKVTYVEIPFCELADVVISGEADMIASGYSNMPERRRILDFSLPYHDTEYFLIVSRDKAKRAQTLRGLNTADVKIGYQFGGVSGMVATGEFSGSDLQGFSSFGEILEALEEGEIDGAVMFEPYLEAAKDMKGRKYRVPHDFALTRTIEAYATAQGSEAFIEVLNEFVIERDLQGFWSDLEEKWFNDANKIAAAPPPHACAAATLQG